MFEYLPVTQVCALVLTVSDLTSRVNYFTETLRDYKSSYSS
jgi:hypothetical protein